MQGGDTMGENLDQKEIEKALKASGYLLEQRICPILEDNFFQVMTNTRYKDIDSDKSLEFDVEALREYELDSDPDDYDSVVVRLFISCNNNHFPVVGFTRKSYKVNLEEEGIFQSIALPSQIRVPKPQAIESYLRFNECHHYYHMPYIARQYCVVSRKMERKEKKKTIYKYHADHGDLYDDIYKMCKTIHIKTTNLSNLKRKIARSVEEDCNEFATEYTICYPIMLFAGDLYECRLMGRRTHIFPTDHILLWHTISTKKLEGEYFIDMIEEAYLKKYLQLLDTEIKEVVRRMVQQRKILHENSCTELKELKASLSQSPF